MSILSAEEAWKITVKAREKKTEELEPKLLKLIEKAAHQGECQLLVDTAEYPYFVLAHLESTHGFRFSMSGKEARISWYGGARIG